MDIMSYMQSNKANQIINNLQRELGYSEAHKHGDLPVEDIYSTVRKRLDELEKLSPQDVIVSKVEDEIVKMEREMILESLKLENEHIAARGGFENMTHLGFSSTENIDFNESVDIEHKLGLGEVHFSEKESVLAIKGVIPEGARRVYFSTNAKLPPRKILYSILKLSGISSLGEGIYEVVDDKESGFIELGPFTLEEDETIDDVYWLIELYSENIPQPDRFNQLAEVSYSLGVYDYETEEFTYLDYQKEKPQIGTKSFKIKIDLKKEVTEEGLKSYQIKFTPPELLKGKDALSFVQIGDYVNIRSNQGENIEEDDLQEDVVYIKTEKGAYISLASFAWIE